MVSSGRRRRERSNARSLLGDVARVAARVSSALAWGARETRRSAAAGSRTFATSSWMRSKRQGGCERVVDVVGDVLTHGADVEDAMRVHVETQAADGVEADDVLERELEHGDRGVVGLERERTGEQANPTAEFAVLARGRRRSEAAGNTPGGAFRLPAKSTT